MSNPELAAFASLSLEAMQAYAVRLAQRLRAGDTVTLRGEVGSGKTTFARALIGAVATGTPDVTSPTFTLMQSYDVMLEKMPQTLWHLDLYRLKHADEAEALGLRDIWEHAVLIEWPEIIEGLLPAARLDIRFDFGPSDTTRSLALHGNDTWRKRLRRVQ